MSVLTHEEAYVDVSIGARIKAARTAAGMTQMDVARRTDLSLQAVGDIERGIVRDPHISSLRQIARALGVSIEALLREEEPPRPFSPIAPGEEPEQKASEPKAVISRVKAEEFFDRFTAELEARMRASGTKERVPLYTAKEVSVALTGGVHRDIVNVIHNAVYKVAREGMPYPEAQSWAADEVGEVLGDVSDHLTHAKEFLGKAVQEEPAEDREGQELT